MSFMERKKFFNAYSG